jgi:NADPH:quinone reductase-like Zn-dependent oxidoreductase
MNNSATTKTTETGSKKKTMLAWAIEGYGGPEKMQLMKLPIPTPNSHDVLIEMHGAEVGDWDIMVRQGEWPMNRPFPLILGLAGSGTVAAVGDSVSEFDIGEFVYTYSYPMYDNGAWAEYMLVPASYIARAPNSLALVSAGAVPIVGLTAHETLIDILKVETGDIVLITAASGGVGHLAVQIAVDRGARVVATASLRNREFLRQFGAETVINYTNADVVSAIYESYPQGIDKILNGVGGETANKIVNVLRPGGHMIDLTGSASLKRDEVRVDTDYVVKADAPRLARIAHMIDDGDLDVEIQEVVPFDKVRRALQLIEAKHVRGKLVLGIR